MGKSSSSPDVTDVAMMIGAIESLHDCRVEIVVTTHGQGHNGIVYIRLTAAFVVLGAPENRREVTVHSQYPCRECATFDGHLFKGLYGLDFAIGQAYSQEKIPGA